VKAQFNRVMQSEGWALNGRLTIGVLGDELKAEDYIAL
jgi:hypothetical protein